MQTTKNNHEVPLFAADTQKTALPGLRAHHRYAATRRKNFGPPFRCYRNTPGKQVEGSSCDTTRQDKRLANQGQETTLAKGKTWTRLAYQHPSPASRFGKLHAVPGSSRVNPQCRKGFSPVQPFARVPRSFAGFPRTSRTEAFQGERNALRTAATRSWSCPDPV